MERKHFNLKFYESIVLIVFLLCAITLPLIKVTSFYIFTDKISIKNVIIVLFKNGDYSLAIFVAVIGFIMPLSKTILHPFQLSDVKAYKILYPAVNRFSSLDLFLAALTIFFIKVTSHFTIVKSQIGLYFLICFLSMSFAVSFRHGGQLCEARKSIENDSVEVTNISIEESC